MSTSTTTGLKWYALQCLSNHESKVERYLAKYKEENEEFAQCLNKVLVPIETVSEVKNGKKRQRDRKFYPGYVFVEMKLFDQVGILKKKPWYKIKETDGVINFIGKENPTPLAADEIGRILKQVNEAEGKEVPKVKFTQGELVKILDGPFLNLTGEIEEIDPQKGWGLIDESWNAMDMISRYGGVDWFQLGDRDLGTHMYRTHRLLQGASLSTVTEEIANSLKVKVNILPVSDDSIKTFVTTSDLGELEFQEYFVRHKHDLKVTEVHFKGIENATPGPNVIDEIQSASAIIIAPSNPIVSISPILLVPGVSEALQQKKGSTVAVSGIINGKALKGPADRMLLDLGHEVSPAGIAKIYQHLASKFVLDQADSEHTAAIEKLGLRCLATETMIPDQKESAKLCSTILSTFFPEVIKNES